MDDDKTLRPLLKCPMCREIMADPVRLRICGHTFCHFCLVQHLRKSRTCSQCNRQLKNAGHKAYTADLGLQELAYRCFPDETVQSMRKKFDLAASKKPIAYQLCAANLIYLLQHHISVASEKVRLRICLSKKRIVSTHRDPLSDNSEMILRCDHDIPFATIKKLFSQKFQLSAPSLNLFSSDTLSLDDSDTVGDLVLRSGGFDMHFPVIIYACLRDEENQEEIEENLPPLDDDMPILELESYEADAPSPLLPVLEPELPTTSQAFEPVIEQIPQEQTNPVPDFPTNTPSTPNFDQMTSVKRKTPAEEVRSPKIRKTNSRSEVPNQSPTTPNDFMTFFNYMSSASHQPIPQQIPIVTTRPSASATSSIFAPTTRPNHSEPTIFNNKTPTFPFIPPEFAMAFQYQMLANGPPALKQKQPAQIPQIPQIFPSFTSPPSQQNNIAQLATLQKSMVDAQHYNEFWTRFLQMNGQNPPKMNVKKPGVTATVKPMRRESYKPSQTTPTEQRPDKNGSVDYKDGGNGAASESDHLHHYLTCAKI